MRLVAIVKPPARADEAARTLADASGLTLAEARMRLAPEPPALLARLPAEAARAMVASLRTAGLAVVTVPVDVSTDADRTPAQRFSLDSAGPTFTPRSGTPVQAPWAELLAVLRGLRSSRTEVERTEKTKGFSASRALLSGGLVMTRSSIKTVRSADEQMEGVILVLLRDGRAVTLAERALDFTCLGPGMQPSSTGNMVELARRLREQAPGAFHDDRLVRLGRRPLPFLAGGDPRSVSGTTIKTHSSTAEALDVLVEVMRQALTEGLLR